MNNDAAMDKARKFLQSFIDAYAAQVKCIALAAR